METSGSVVPSPAGKVKYLTPRISSPSETYASIDLLPPLTYGKYLFLRDHMLGGIYFHQTNHTTYCRKTSVMRY